MLNSTNQITSRRRRLRWVAAAVLTLLFVGGAGAVAVSVSKPDAIEATLPAGSVLIGTLEHTVSTETNEVGDRVNVALVEPLPLGSDSVLPAGAQVSGEITHATGGGRIAGAPELTIRFTDLELDGERYRIDAVPFRVKGSNDVAESIAEIGGGAVAGGVLGGVLGGGDDAVKGGLIGAAIGTGVAVATEGDQLVLPAGQKLRVELAAPTVVSVRPPSAS